MQRGGGTLQMALWILVFTGMTRAERAGDSRTTPTSVERFSRVGPRIREDTERLGEGAVEVSSMPEPEQIHFVVFNLKAKTICPNPDAEEVTA